jgi:drug/metabolite transporter (DMT)-like permease
MIRSRTPRRIVGACALVGGALLMWLAPGALFGSGALAGASLMVAGIVLELIGIALERRR